METRVRQFFLRYEQSFNQALAGDLDMDALTDLYASSFIAASPAGVRTAANDEAFRQAMIQGYAYYRAIGTKAMRIRDVRIDAIDACHCLAHVAWTAVYMREGGQDVTIDFDVHYFIQQLDGEPRVFGWVSGDEQALLRERGII